MFSPCNNFIDYFGRCFRENHRNVLSFYHVTKKRKQKNLQHIEYFCLLKI